jgi:hypothetical protein
MLTSAHLGLSSPQQYIVAHPSAVDAQGRAPGSTPNHAYLGPFIREARSRHGQAGGVSRSFARIFDWQIKRVRQTN